MGSDTFPASPAVRLEQLTAALQGPIVKPRVSWLYRAGLMAVAAAMVVLPILYLALAVATAWGVVRLDEQLIASGLTGRALAFALASVTVGGGAVVLFMFKPLLAPRPSQPDPYPVAREGEPVLFGFVEHLCRLVGAPAPASIKLDCNVNASASFRRGMASFIGSDLNLTIGLPLVSGMTLRQFAGVLAHEFGHFAQGTGMRLTYVIRSVNHWFARVVYERDGWDQALVQWSQSGSIWISLVVAIARGAVWMARRILWALMMVGHAISSFALRQMEFDADAYETQIGGSDNFEATSGRLAELSLASQVAHNQLAGAWTGRRLVDNLPAFIAARAATLDAEMLKRLHEHTLGRKTGLLDTHPADADRIAAARRVDVPGVFGVEAPATVLFRDYDSVSREVSRRHYALMVGDSLNEATLQDVERFMVEGLAEQESGDALRQIFGPVIMPMRAVPSGRPEVVTPSGVDAAVAALRGHIREMNATADAARASMARFLESDGRLVEVHKNIGVAEAWAALDRTRTEQREDVTALNADLGRLTAEADKAASDFDRYMDVAERRFGLGLGLAECDSIPGMAKAVSVLASGVGGFRTALEALDRACDTVTDLRIKMVRIYAAVVEHDRNPGIHSPMLDHIRNATRVLANQLIALRKSLDVPFPFEHAEGDIRLGAMVVMRLPAADDIGEVLSVAQDAIGNAFNMRLRILAHLSRVVRRVERVVVPNEPASPLSDGADAGREGRRAGPAA